MRCNTTKVENELKALQKTLEDKDNEIKGLQDLVASRNDEVSELKENNEKLNQDLYAQMERNDEVEKQLSELLEAAKTPIKKVVPESGLRQLPLVGDKMLRGLIPFLEKYNIVIDPNR